MPFIGVAIFTLILGTVYYQLDLSSEAGIQNRTGLFYFVCLELAYFNGNAVDIFIRDQARFKYDSFPSELASSYLFMNGYVEVVFFCLQTRARVWVLLHFDVFLGQGGVRGAANKAGPHFILLSNTLCDDRPPTQLHSHAFLGGCLPLHGSGVDRSCHFLHPLIQPCCPGLCGFGNPFVIYDGKFFVRVSVEPFTCCNADCLKRQQFSHLSDVWRFPLECRLSMVAGLVSLLLNLLVRSLRDVYQRDARATILSQGNHFTPPVP